MTDPTRLQKFTTYMQGRQDSIQEKDHVEGGQLLSGRFWKILYWVPLISVLAKWHFVALSKQEVRSLNERRFTVHLDNVDKTQKFFMINGHTFAVKEDRRHYPANYLIPEWQAPEAESSPKDAVSVDIPEARQAHPAGEEQEPQQVDEDGAVADIESDEDTAQREEPPEVADAEVSGEAEGDVQKEGSSQPGDTGAGEDAFSEVLTTPETDSADQSAGDASRERELALVRASHDPLLNPHSTRPSESSSPHASQPASEVLPSSATVSEVQAPTLQERWVSAAPYIASYCRHAGAAPYTDAQFSTMLATLYPFLQDHPIMELLVAPVLAATVESDQYSHLAPQAAFQRSMSIFRTEVHAAKTKQNPMRGRMDALRKCVEDARKLAQEWKKGPLPEKHVGQHLTEIEKAANKNREAKERAMYEFADTKNADLLTRHLFIYLNETAVRSKQLTEGVASWGVWLASAAHATGVAKGLIESFVQNAVINILKLAAYSQKITEWNEDVNTSRKQLAHAATGFLPGFLNNRYHEVITEVKFLQYLDAYIQGKGQLDKFNDRLAEVLEAAAKQAELFQEAFVAMITEQRARLAKK